MSERSDIAVVLAAGRGRRLGQDKALVDLDGLPAVARLVSDCRRGGAAEVVVVRATGADPLPDGLAARIVETGEGEMIDSLRAGLLAGPGGRAASAEGAGAVLIAPVDYPLVGQGVVAELFAVLRRSACRPRVVLPLCAGRPGHPIGVTAPLIAEIVDPTTTSLREVIRRDPGRVEAISVQSSWVLRDIDEPADLRAARGYLRCRKLDVTALMRAHRSRRSYLPDPVGDPQFEWLVDSARHCSTSSFAQAYAVVAVRDAAKKGRIGELCADQRHIREAPLFLAVCADLAKIAASCGQHGRPLAADSLEIFVQATVDAALFGQNLQLAAESEGLGSCMIGAARDHPVALARLCELPPHVYVVFGMTLGWPADDPVPRGRMPLGAVLHHDRYRIEELPRHLAEADAAMRRWAKLCNEGAGDSGRRIDERKGWTDRMAKLWGGEAPPKARADLLDELRRLGFGLVAGPAADPDSGPAEHD